MLGVGIVGTGAIGQTHAEALAGLPDVRVTAVSSRGDSTTSLTRPFRAAIRCSDVAALVERQDVDVVAVCSPPAQHADQVALALARGKHVVVEKPPTADLDEFDRLIRLARSRGLLLSVVSQQRLLPHARYMAGLIADGRLGRPMLGEVRLHWHRPRSYYDDKAWRRTDPLGGSLANQGWHAVDLLSWFFGPAARVTACAATLAHDVAVEDTLAATVLFGSGAIGSIVTSTVTAPGDPATIELFFERGTITLTDDTVTRWVAPADVPPPRKSVSAGSGAGDPTAIGVTAHREYWTDVLQAVRGGHEPVVTAPSGWQTLALVLAAYAAARSGRAVVPARQSLADAP